MTPSEAVIDAPTKPLRTHCINNHELTPENVRERNGRRHCRTCDRDYKRRKAERTRAGLVRPRDHMVPVEPLAQLIEEYQLRNPLFTKTGWAQDRESNGSYLLAERAHIGPRIVWKLLRREFKQVEFSTADKLVCAMNAVQEWHVGRLAPYYLPLPSETTDLSPCDSTLNPHSSVPPSRARL
jgi:hypothetical protein